MNESAPRFDAVGPTKPSERYPRWLILHRASGLEHETKGRVQYAHGALALAIEEGFATRLLAVGQDFPSFADCEFVERVEDSDAERVDASCGRDRVA